MTKPNSLILLFGFILAGCAGNGTARDSILSEYVDKQVYPVSVHDLAKYVVSDLKKNHRWHDDDNYIFSTLRGTDVDIKFTIRGASADLRDVEEIIANNGASRAVVTDQDLPTRGSVLVARPIEIWSAHDVYVLQRVQGERNRSTLMIQSQSNRKRLYDRELDVYNQVDHEGAAALRQRILKEHPNLLLQPLG